MAKRLNKQMVLGLTIASMILTTAAMVVVIMNLPQKDPKPAAQEAERLAQAGNFEEAMNKYQLAARRAKAMKDIEQYAEYMVLAGEMALKDGSAGDARRCWTDVMLNDPSNESAQEHTLKLLLEFAKYGGVRWDTLQTEAQKLVDINPENAVGLHALGLALVQQRATNPIYAQEGEKKLAAAVAIDKGNADYVDALALYYLAVDRIDDAEKQYQQLVLDAEAQDTAAAPAPSTEPAASRPAASDTAPSRHETLAKAYLLRGGFFAYMSARLRGEAASASAAQVSTLRARAADAEDKALADLEKAVETAPDNSDALVDLARFWQSRQATGETQQDRQKQAEDNRAQAKKYYEQAIKNAPDTFEAYQGLARVYLAEEEPEKALQVLRTRQERGYNRKHYLAEIDTIRMLGLREDCFKINVNRLFRLSQQQLPSQERKEAQEAIMGELTELYNQTVAETAAGEQHQWALFMKGRLLMAEGNTNGAIATLEQAEKAFPSPPPELRHTLAGLYLRTRAFAPAADQLDNLLTQMPANTAAWQMLAQARLQLYDPTNPQHTGDLARAAAAIKEALRQDPESREGLAILAAVYRAEGNEEEARRIERQLVEPGQLKLRDAVLMAAQAEGDTAKIAQAEKMLREILADDPLNNTAIQSLTQILLERYTRLEDDAQKAEVVAEIDRVISAARSAVENKLAAAASSTQPAAEQERYSEIAKAIERFAIAADPRISDEDKIRKLEALIREGADPYVVATQLFDVYRRGEENVDKAAEQAGRILAMDLKPDQAGIVEQVFLFAIRSSNWSLAEKCIIPASEIGLDPANGHLYRGRLLLAQAGPGENAEEQARRARDELQTAVNTFPRHSMAQAWLGFAHLALKQYGDATAAFEEARQLDPRNAMAVVGLAMIAEARGEEEMFNVLLDLCAQLLPRNPWVVSRLAARQEQADPKQAIAQREAARAKDPEDLANLMVLANLYRRVNQLDESAKIYEECHTLEPGNLAVAERYASLLTARREFAAGEKMLDKVAQSVDQTDAKEKASVQLLKAALLANKTRHEYGSIPPDQQAAVDAAFIEATNICNKPEVIVNVANYFRQLGRLDEAITWQRRVIDATAESQQQLDAQKDPRITLIELLLLTGDRKRGPEIQREIDDFRGFFPQDHRADILEGRMHAMQGDDAKAIEAFANYIKSARDDAIGYALRGQTHFRASRWGEAIKDLQEVKRLNPTYMNYAARLMLARALYENGQVDAAISELQSILADSPNHQQAVEDLVSIYESPDRLGATRRGATDSLLAARMQADPQNPVWPGIRTSVAMGRNQPEEAIRYAREAAQRSKSPEGELDPARIRLLFNLCLQLNRYDELLAFVKDRLPPSQQSLPAVHLYVGSAYAAKNDAARAVEHYLTALEPPDADPGIGANMILTDIRSGRLKADEAAAAVKKRLDAQPNDHLARLLALLIENERSGAPASMEAYRELAESIQADTPKNRAIVLWLKLQMALTAHMQKKQYDEARKLYEQMLEMEPRHLVALNNLAYMLMSDMNDPQSALPYAEQAAKIAPNEGGVLDTLGWCHVLLKNYDDAVARLRQAMQLRPEMAAIHYHAAEAFYRRANADKAEDREMDLETAKTEVRRAHEIISSGGKDDENVLEKVIELGGRLGLPLTRPASGPATATAPES